eukprot:c20082_g1_i3.p1 GENE.c20082_g1_i3~~c20082_g1_i3.p1  ORF type:complete len:418 (+),score=91.71 c20082_g1_i3:263-1516(+)
MNSAMDIYLAAHQNLMKLTKNISWELLIDKKIVKELIETTRAILILNADNNTAWNIRKRLLILNLISKESEIRFLNLVFTKHPRRADAWAHRYWVFSKIENKTQEFISSELKICSEAAKRHLTNYYAWSYRHRIINSATEIELLVEELNTMELWVKSHISEYAGFTHLNSSFLCLINKLKQFVSYSEMSIKEKSILLFKGIISEEKNVHELSESFVHMKKISLLLQEFTKNDSERSLINPILHLFQKQFDISTELILRYPGHESIWTHRRLLFVQLNNEIINNDIDKKILNSISFDLSDNNDKENKQNDENDVYMIKPYLYSNKNKWPCITRELLLCDYCIIRTAEVTSNEAQKTQQMLAIRYVFWMYFETNHFSALWKNYLETLEKYDKIYQKIIIELGVPNSSSLWNFQSILISE